MATGNTILAIVTRDGDDTRTAEGSKAVRYSITDPERPALP